MKKYDEIEEFGCDDYMYWMRRKDTVWSVIVVRFNGSVSLDKFSKVEGEKVDRFLAKQIDGVTEIYLRTNGTQGTQSRFIGKTSHHEAAKQWIGEVNQLYERHRSKTLGLPERRKTCTITKPVRRFLRLGAIHRPQRPVKRET